MVTGTAALCHRHGLRQAQGFAPTNRVVPNRPNTAKLDISILAEHERVDDPDAARMPEGHLHFPPVDDADEGLPTRREPPRSPIP